MYFAGCVLTLKYLMHSHAGALERDAGGRELTRDLAVRQGAPYGFMI